MDLRRKYKVFFDSCSVIVNKNGSVCPHDWQLILKWKKTHCAILIKNDKFCMFEMNSKNICTENKCSNTRFK